MDITKKRNYCNRRAPASCARVYSVVTRIASGGFSPGDPDPLDPVPAPSSSCPRAWVSSLFKINSLLAVDALFPSLSLSPIVVVVGTSCNSTCPVRLLLTNDVIYVLVFPEDFDPNPLYPDDDGPV